MHETKNSKAHIPCAFRRLNDGRLVELLYVPDDHSTRLAISDKGTVIEVENLDLEDGTTLVPISPNNNLIKHRAILLPSKAEPYASVHELAAIISGYLFKYVDLSDSFRKIATCYILLTWVYDAFNELPYLRLRGDFGSGKTRALSVIGSVCYRPFFASGASTVSPIFHILDFFGGTLVLDEGDFRFSDEKSELVKIFNNGNVKGFPVLRTAITLRKEFDPRAFVVFGPKLIGMRRSFDDQALESRFLTEKMGQRPLRKDIPINLPKEQEAEALALRNQLLMYRFRTLDSIKLKSKHADWSRSPRLNQILLPLLSVIDDPAIREEIWETAGKLEGMLYRERSATMDAGVLEVMLTLFREPGRKHVTIAEITAAFTAKFGPDYQRPVTNKGIGGIVRKRLRLAVYKSHGVYVIPIMEAEKIEQMAIRFGVAGEDEKGYSGGLGDVGTSEEDSIPF